MKKDLAFTSRSAWEVYADVKNTRAMQDLAERYRKFLSACKTERESIDYLRERLEKAGFSGSGKGDKIYRVLQNKTMFVARRGKGSLASGLRLLAAHVDTPRLDFKQHPLQEQANVGQAKTHYYGGIRKYQWLARPLAVHGVVVKADGTMVKVTLGEDPREPVFTILDLLPHLAQSQAETPLAKAFEGEKLNLVLGHRPLVVKPARNKKDEDKPKEPVKASILALLNEKYGITEEDLYSAELQAVPAGEARYVGLDSSMIGGYGQDDRVCVFAALESFLAAAPGTGHTQCLMFWDKEEIGSEGSTGAKSRFFEYCVQECIRLWEPKADFAAVMMRTKAISADVHAAIDPDWQDLHEKLNSALFGHGPCFCKFTGHKGKYEANDAHPEYVGWLRSVLNKENIPWQMAELGKVDHGGGGTVAMYLAAYGMNIIDCGPPVLSMHSPFELLSNADLYAIRLAFTAFLSVKYERAGVKVGRKDLCLNRA